MRGSILVSFLLLIVVVVSGCWDENLLKDNTQVKAVSFDKAEEGKILLTLSTPVISQGEIVYTFHSSLANTPREGQLQIERRVHEHLDGTKNRLVVISEELAKEGIYPLLDVFYRDPKSALMAKVAISKDKGQEALQADIEKNLEIGEFISDLILSAEENTFVPKANLQLICPLMFDEGMDFAVPYIEVRNNQIDLTGIALFNDMYMTGTLNAMESAMFLLLADKKGKELEITQRVHNNKESEIENFINIDIQKVTRDLNISFQDNTVVVDLDLILKATISEYAEDHLSSRENVVELNNALSDNLTELSTHIITKMQEANFDGFGIGRRIYAFHQKEWKKMNWKEVYPNIHINPNVTVEITHYGIIN